MIEFVGWQVMQYRSVAFRNDGRMTFWDWVAVEESY